MRKKQNNKIVRKASEIPVVDGVVRKDLVTHLQYYGDLVGFTNLVWLNCEGNSLTSIPDGMTKLEELYCEGNSLTSLPLDMINLVLLYCSSNRLTSLPSGMTKLEELYCSNNRLTSLPSGMTKLEKLHCDRNQMTSLPGGMVNLVVLYCSINNLTSLPSGMTKLEKLHCSGNNLTSLPSGMVNLVVLYCQNNRLTSLPLDMIKLEELYPILGMENAMSYRKYILKYMLAASKIQRISKTWPQIKNKRELVKQIKHLPGLGSEYMKGLERFNKFGRLIKKTKKLVKKPSKKPSKALIKQAKRYRIHLTVKKNGKRVYKSTATLKRQIKKHLKK